MMQYNAKRFSYTILILFLSGWMLNSCSVKKDSFKNRQYHKMTAWFNTLFNGQEAMDTKLEELEESYQDDYFSTLRVEPLPEFEEKTDFEDITIEQESAGFFNKARGGNFLDTENSSRSGFEKAEEKALKAIEKHSMDIKGEEKNKLISRAYLMLGQARYYQGKTFPALEALQFLIKDLPFDKHTPEAKYYLALSYIQAGDKFTASEYLQELYDDEEISKALKENVAKHYAQIFLDEGDYVSALNGLDTAIENARKKDNEARYNFIQGQILSELGRFDEAGEKFMRAYKLKPGFEMEARSQTAIASNFNPIYDDYDSYKSRLEKLAKIGTYKSHYNEFYMAIADMSMKRDSLDEAEQFLKKALSEEIINNRYKGEAYAKMGEVKFKKSDYVYAAAYYDSAVSVYPESDRKIDIIAKRDALQSVKEKYYLVLRNDSILRLTKMNDKERKSFFTDYIEELKIADEARQKEEEEEALEIQTEGKRSSFSSSFGNEDKGKFYFYTNASKSFGVNEFQRIWGNVRLQDNWRNSTAGTSIVDEKATLTGTENLSNPRRYDLSYYLENIPSQQKDIDLVKMERDTTELSLGVDYLELFKDKKLAAKTLNHLVETPPMDDEVLLKAYYNLYRINKDINAAEETKYKNLILNQFPNTIYAEYILNPDTQFVTANTVEALAMYDKAFAAYQEKEYSEVKTLAAQAVEKYPTEKIIAKFALLNALSDGAIQGKAAMIDGLKRVIVIYDGTEEAEYAQNLIDQLQGKGSKKKKSAPKKVIKNTTPKPPEKVKQQQVVPSSIRRGDLKKETTAKQKRAKD